ncbi:MAG: hypothetical protein GWN18_17800, partial [Thermoplasmata archaeon]|nr:hypothetical protein [Thermoplasmata archaeon]NIS13979.1 hypothetical protein [Thermoplasmata archaeon]NIS21816.1 hypothetical protein [Thermoplasmata archaeon]NIT79421.1 hypothetical protein [Thermoplasmata archaeon]NIU50849.1 hypothetical protein [Thermoplasmata archaeon]
VWDTVVPTLHTDFTWYLTVYNVNRAPVIDSYEPDRYWNVNESQDGSVLFTVSASDQDDDTLSYTWYVNSQYVSGTGDSYLLEF